MARGSSWTKSW
jgi:hypothetical protein